MAGDPGPGGGVRARRNGDTVHIRPAAPSDADRIFTFIHELAASEGLGHSVDADRDRIAHALFSPQPRVFSDIAEWSRKGGAPDAAGCAIWHYNFSTFRGRHGLYLEDLYVSPEFRRRGIGEALLHHLARRCRREGLARFEWRVQHWNPALAFYRAMGAEVMDDWKICRVTGDALDRLAGPPPS